MPALPADPSCREVSVLYVNHNGGNWIITSIERLLSLYPEVEIIVADNGSTDGSPGILSQRFPTLKVVHTGWNAGYAGGNNYAAQYATRKFLFIFNPDALVLPGSIEPLVSRLVSDSQIGAVGPKLRKGWTDGGSTLDSAGGILEFPLGEGPSRGYLAEDGPEYSAPLEVPYLSGAALLIARATFLRYGGFDERLWSYCEETDLCWRLRMTGLHCFYEPASIVYHKGSAIFGDATPQKIYLQTRNRININLQNLEMQNVFYFAVAELIVGSFVQIGALIKRPELALAYMKAWRDVALNLPVTLRVRRQRQDARTVPDSVVLRLHTKVGIIRTLRRYVGFVLQGRKTLFGKE